MTALFPDLEPALRVFEVTVTLPAPPADDPQVPAGLASALERAASRTPASGVMSAWTAAKTIVCMAVRAADGAAAMVVALGVVREALGDEGIGTASVSAVPGT